MVQPWQVDAVEAGDREVLRDPEPERLGGPDRPGREQVGLGDDGGRPLRGGDVEQQPGRCLAGLDREVVRLDDGGVATGDRAEPRDPTRGIRVGRGGEVGVGDRPGGGGRAEGHRQVRDPGVAEREHVLGGEPHRRRLVGEHVGDAWVDGGAAAHERDAAGEQVVDERVLAVATQREHRCVDRLGRELCHRTLGVVERLRDEEHRAPGGVELLGEPVEDREGEGVVERVPQRALDDDGDGADAALPQGGREGVGAGVREVGGRGPDPLRRRLGDRALAAEDERGRRRRDAGAHGDVTQGGAAWGPGLTDGCHAGHNIESIRSNRFDLGIAAPARPARHDEGP